MKKIIAIVIVVLALAGTAWVVKQNRIKAGEEVAKAAKAKLAPVPVLLTNVTTMTMPVEISTFGSVEPLTTVSVKSQITGILSKVHFSEGQEVQEGTLLFELDSRNPAAALRQVEAALEKDRVQWANANKEAERFAALLTKGFVAQDVHDKAVTDAETLKAMLRADEAAVESARLQLSYCSIRAPVSGRTGNLLIHQGNLVKADDATLVTINQIHPIMVQFVLPQRELARVRDCLEQGGLTLKATPQGGTGLLAVTGVVTFVDNAVNENTGTIQLKARFDNVPAVLWPGQFVKVILQLSKQENAVVIPESAVLFGQQGTYVYLVGLEGTVAPRFVGVDRTVAGLSVIASGLVPGDQIVVDGQIRLKPGSLVKSKTPSTKPESIPAGRP